MRLGFHYHVPVLKKEDGDYYTSGAIGVFIDSMAAESEEIYCFFHTALPAEISQMDYRLEHPNIRVVEIGPHDHMFKRVASAGKIKKMIAHYLYKVDLMLIRGPSPLLPAISELCYKNNKPYSYLLVGDYIKSLDGSNLRGLKRFILKHFYQYNKNGQDRFAKHALVFANSAVIYDEYRSITQELHAIKTTTLKKEDFFLKEDAVLHQPIELLYTGRIEPAKGLDEVIDAMVLLRDEGCESVLNLVGWEDKRGYIDHLMQKAKKFSMEGTIIFHGKKRVGAELFSMYKNADIYVIASKGNEGFPRTVWEALANSLPVIASRLGSIPYFLDDGENVLLTEPGNANEIAENIRLLVKDSSLRKKLIRNGILIAKENTLEKQASDMVAICQKYLQDIEYV